LGEVRTRSNKTCEREDEMKAITDLYLGIRKKVVVVERELGGLHIVGAKAV